MSPSLPHIVATALGCAFLQQPIMPCTEHALAPQPAVAGARVIVPEHTGESVDVVLTAQSALVWDVDTGKILYEKNATEPRPVASLTKLMSAVAVRSLMAPTTVVEIPAAVRSAQLSGANIQLPIGHHATVQDLLRAGLVASANDAMVALAYATSGSEEDFVTYANTYVKSLGLEATILANATGLEGGEQYSTAQDIQRIFSAAYEDTILSSFLGLQTGVLVTQEGTRRQYETTNELIGSYLPVLAGKTGYTLEAKENLVLITENDEGRRIGAIILASDQRFQDMKILVEWIWRNYSWETTDK